MKIKLGIKGIIDSISRGVYDRHYCERFKKYILLGSDNEE